MGGGRVLQFFVFWSHGALTTGPMEHAYKLHTHLLLYVVCCNDVAHGGWAARFAGVSMGWWVGGCLRRLGRGWLCAFVAVGGDPLLSFCLVIFVRYYTGPALA